MSKMGLMVGSSHEKMKVLAMQTTKGSAEEYYSRLLRNDTNISWVFIINSLKVCFSDLTDTQYAMQK